MVLEALWEGAPRRTFKESKNPLPISKSLQIRVIHPDTHLVTHTPTHTTHTPSRPLGSATHPHVSVTSIMSPKRWQNHRPPWKKKHSPAEGRGHVGGAWGSRRVALVFWGGTHPETPVERWIWLTTYHACTFLVIRVQNTLYHITNTRGSATPISLSVPSMVPRRGTDKTGRDGSVVVKLPWRTAQNTHLIILLFFWFLYFSQNPLVLTGKSLYTLASAFRQKSIIISVYIPHWCECALKGICICPYALIGLFVKTCLLSVCAKRRVTEYLSVYLFLCKHTPSFGRVTRLSFDLSFFPGFFLQLNARLNGHFVERWQ